MTLTPTLQTRPQSAVDPRAARETEEVCTIEVGWIIAGRLDDADYEAVRRARAQILDEMNRAFSEFSWRMPLIRRPELVSSRRIEPVELMEHGVSERDAHRLDFGLVITAADLNAHYKPFAFAAVSRSLDLAVISTARIDPQAVEESIQRDERVEHFAARLTTVARHVLGHLCGLAHHDDPSNLMFDLRTIDDLPPMSQFDSRQLAVMRDNLGQIADVRLEESARWRRSTRLAFYLRSAWLNRHEIRDAVWQAKPWEFPGRLSRLTTAAMSAAMILIMTAETWDMATSQSAATTSLLFVAALAATTVFIMRRQQLLVNSRGSRLSEQTVITNVSASAIVICGMLMTLCVLFGVAFLTASTLFGTQLAGTWAATMGGPFTAWHYAQLSAVVASLAALIGALGASFEEHHHFRHIIFVDEET